MNPEIHLNNHELLKKDTDALNRSSEGDNSDLILALKECYTASFFWTRFFGKAAQNKKLVTELEQFLSTLTALLMTKFVPNFWFPQNPRRASGHRSLQFLGESGGLDPVFVKAAKLAGSFELSAHSPNQHLIMFVNPGDVKIRNADSLQTVTLPLQHPPDDFIKRLNGRIQQLSDLKLLNSNHVPPPHYPSSEEDNSPTSSVATSRSCSRNDDEVPADNAVSIFHAFTFAPPFQPRQ
jgi:hypothetical protein